MAGGRPTTFTQDVADAICNWTSTTALSLKNISLKEDVDTPVRTILQWLEHNVEFAQQYARAKQEQADMLVEQMLEIADDNSRDAEDFVGANHVNRARLQIDTRKWIAAHLKPKKYGEKYFQEERLEDKPEALNIMPPETPYKPLATDEAQIDKEKDERYKQPNRD